MNVEFLEPAEAEFNDAIAFYNLQREGLGFEFEGEVKNTIEKIVRSPEVWTPLSKRTRRCQTKRFPLFSFSLGFVRILPINLGISLFLPPFS